jgi:hypothetical protein
MAERSFPFDAGAGATISETDWQKMARRFLASGVITGYLNQLAVTADGSSLSVSVATGGAFVEGFYYENDAAKAVPLAAANASNPRIDTIVVRLDRVANTTLIDKVTGTPAASPVAPTLSQTDSLYELPLANVLVPAAAGVIVAGNVTDRRAFVRNLTEAAGNAAYAPKAIRSARASLNGATLINTSTWTAVPLTVESFDSSDYHSTVTNPSRFTAVSAGLAGRYIFTGLAVWASSSAAGEFRVAMARNGVRIRELPTGSFASQNFSQMLVDQITLAEGDYLELHVWQNAAATRQLNEADVSITHLGTV